MSRSPSTKRTKRKDVPTLRVWHSNNPNHAAHWCYFVASGEASGSVTWSGIPMLVARALERAAT